MSACVGENYTSQGKNHPEGVEEMIFRVHTGPGIVLVPTSHRGKLSRLENLLPKDPD